MPTRIGEWTHAARQLADGWWTSKLGPAEDIRHRTPQALAGDQYGQVVAFMKRPTTELASPSVRT